jgi:hypothetical protein
MFWPALWLHAVRTKYKKKMHALWLHTFALILNLQNIFKGFRFNFIPGRSYAKKKSAQFNSDSSVQWKPYSARRSIQTVLVFNKQQPIVQKLVHDIITLVSLYLQLKFKTFFHVGNIKRNGKQYLSLCNMVPIVRLIPQSRIYICNKQTPRSIRYAK